jgi:hypothetical protein
MTTWPVTPELDRQREIIEAGRAGVLQDFLDWLSENGYWIARYQRWEGYRDEVLVPVGRSPQQLMELFFEIDPVKIEAERRALLAEIARRQP